MSDTWIEIDEGPKNEDELQQEAYYWHCISEFYGMLKYFGTEKVMQDLKTFKESVEKPKDEPRIQLVS